MKLENPPELGPIDFNETLDIFLSGKFEDFFEKDSSEYLYWDEFKYKKDLPFPEDPVKSWKSVRFIRKMRSKGICIHEYCFQYYLTSSLQKQLHEFDMKMYRAAEIIYKDALGALEKTDHLSLSLYNEAVASSQIEGASTTTEVALEMLKSQRKPRNESEQMIFNNLRAIRYIQENLEKEIRKSFLIELHAIMTANTSAKHCAGSYRKSPIYVKDHIDGEIAHIPPSWEKIEDLMEDVFKFINDQKNFIHPIVKASMIHFLVGYIHPFIDGNGRTARALFYWYLLKNDYTLIKNLSISRAIIRSRIQYDKAFLKTEYDNNDLTYFILYSMKALNQAFDKMVDYYDKKKENNILKIALSDSLSQMKGLLIRKAKTLAYLYVDRPKNFSLKDYAYVSGVSRATARKDLSDLVRLGYLKEEKSSRNSVFTLASEDLIKKVIQQDPFFK